MSEEEERMSQNTFTPKLLVDYYNLCTNNKHVFYSEFKGFTKINIVEYILVLNFLDNGDRTIDYIDLYSIKSFIVKSRLKK